MTGDKMLKAVGQISPELINESYFEENENNKIMKIGHRRRTKLLPLVAIMIMILSLSVFASENLNSDRVIDILNFMGLVSSDAVQLQDGTVEIHVSQNNYVENRRTGEYENVSFATATSVGDRNNIYVKIVTNIQVPDDFDPDKDYFMADGWTVSINKGRTSWGGSLNSQVENGMVCFYMNIQDAKKINTAKMDVTFSDIYLYHDKQLSIENSGITEADVEERELIYTGVWNLKWKNQYKSRERKVGVRATVQNQAGYSCELKRVEITPLEIRVTGYVKEKNGLVAGNIGGIDTIEKIQLKDGTLIDLRGHYGGGSAGNSGINEWLNRYEVTGYVDICSLGQVIDPVTVEKIWIGGVEINL